MQVHINWKYRVTCECYVILVLRIFILFKTKELDLAVRVHTVDTTEIKKEKHPVKSFGYQVTGDMYVRYTYIRLNKLLNCKVFLLMCQCYSFWNISKILVIASLGSDVLSVLYKLRKQRMRNST